MSVESEISDQLYKEVKTYLISQIGEDQGLSFHRWLIRYKDDVPFLKKVYQQIKNESVEPLVDNATGLTFQTVRDALYVSSDSRSDTYPLSSVIKALQVMIDMFNTYLPLGTVVNLDKEQLKSTMDLGSAKDFRVVITQRLAALPSTPVYFNYGGLIYPFGSFEGAESIYFDENLIESVVHEGFSDESDLAYLAAMKAELVTRRAYTSFLLASKELRQAAQKELREREG